MKKTVFFFFLAITFFSYSEDIKMVLQSGKSLEFKNLYMSKDGEIIAGTTADKNKVIFFDKYGTIINSYADPDNNIISASVTISSDDKYAIIPYTVYNVIFEINSGRFKIANNYADAYHRHSYTVKILDDKTYLAAFLSNISIPVLIPRMEFENKILSKIQDKTNRDTIKNLYMESPDDPDIMLMRSDIKYDWDYESIIDDTGYEAPDEKCLTVDKFEMNGKYIKTVYAQKINRGNIPTGMIQSDDKSKIIIYTAMNDLILIDLNYGKLSEIIVSHDVLLNWNNIKFINKDRNIFVASNGSPVYYIYNLDGLLLQEIKTPGTFLGFDGNDSKIITMENRINSDKRTKESYLNYLSFDGKKINDRKINIQPDTSSVYSEKNKLLYFSSNKTLKAYSIDTGKSATIAMDLNDWLIFNDAGFWECSRNGGKFITLVKGYYTYSIDQMAVKYNRPDIIYSDLGSAEKDRLDHYKALYEKRLKKLGLTEKDLNRQSEPPEVIIDEYALKGETANLKFTIKQTVNKIISYNIFINDVPIYGVLGRQLTIEPVNNIYKMNEDVSLTPGENKIEISAMDSTGLESFRAVVKVRFNPGRVEGYKPSDLYFIGFGVSKYKDANLNLKYADKDAADLKNVFDKMKNNYKKVYCYTFANEQVTKENIINAKKLIENAKENDTLVLFIAGHGLHDKGPEAKYYYILYDTDINNLSGTAADFELIENILQGIKPRHKLFLMDTCESGELDDIYIDYTSILKDNSRIASRSIKRISDSSQKKTEGKRYYLYNTNRYIYNNLLRRTGTIVFSACKGSEYSYEDDKYENGFFTEELIVVLTKTESERININDFKNQVIEGVNIISSGLQNPTIVLDNIYVNFYFPIIKD